MRAHRVAGLMAACWLVACGGDTLFGNGEGGATSAGGTGGTAGNGGDATGGNGGDGGDGGDGGSTTSSGGMGGTGGTGGMGGGGGNPCIEGPSTQDMDADGFTLGDGDCDDCDPLINPNAVEVSGDTVDEDCDGQLDNALAACDNVGLVVDAPITVIGAVELCKSSSGPDDWGVVSASWVMPDGAPPPTDPQALANFHLGHGVMPSFGPNVGPRAGSAMLALSSGTARRPGDPGYQDPTGSGLGYQGMAPAGFPKAGPCMMPGQADAFDPTAIEAVVRVPSNAFGFSFDFNVYAADFPQFVCSAFNDAFSAQVLPTPMGLADSNVTFHGMDLPFSLNAAPFDACGCMMGPPCMAGGQSYACSQGTMTLEGNGFGADAVMSDRGATGWQITTVPVDPGSEITVRFAVWDAGDGIMTTTTLVDNFTWLTDQVTMTQTLPVP